MSMATKVGRMVTYLECLPLRGLLTPLFDEDSPYIAYPPFQILSNTPPHPHTPSTVVVALFLWLDILLYDIMDLNLSSLGTIVLAAPCCVFYTTRH